MGTMPLRLMSFSTGCSTRHETHHEAHTFSSHTLPFICSGENVACGSCSFASVKAGRACR